MRVVGLLLAALAVVSGMKEESFGRIKAMNGPVVSNSASAAGRVPGFTEVRVSTAR